MASAALSPLPPRLCTVSLRALLRASAATFKDDSRPEMVCAVCQKTCSTNSRSAFRLKMRNEALACPPSASPQQVEEKTNLAKEIADVLLRNVVQAVRLDEAGRPQDSERFKLRITEHTEIASNDTIKDPPTMESSRSARKRVSSSDAARTSETKAAKQRVVPELKADDLEESFVRGSGPGGQSINKTENNVQLLHKPTGLRVSCQDTRSLEQNRKLARRRLLEKLDALYNPGLSKGEMKSALQRERERRRKKKSKKSKRNADDMDDDESEVSS
ncbi:RF-1 domain-containing protein [Fomitopsis serialis]|uniref:RF-1 domain-containing protein n=1 Tax=Fomitopsis serialis TaxID=139415 RepID=UPI00200776E5|nr:RF-1 domain-containing protein [Neoantrodia serialis]KAH9926125.1 RF-1 domain-containing protein [Neoantrodia serialis]